MDTSKPSVHLAAGIRSLQEDGVVLFNYKRDYPNVVPETYHESLLSIARGILYHINQMVRQNAGGNILKRNASMLLKPQVLLGIPSNHI